MSVFIRQLTGIRFVAAFWVFAYHLQGPFNVLGLLSIPVMGDVMRVGRLGVDLFFALSGFILTHTYLTRMGSSIRGSATLRFWWLCLARIYPVHLVMLVIAGLAVFAQARILGEDIDRDWWNPIDFIKNLLLIQEWGPNPERGWNFVAWSLSMEWLAYLVFPVLVLILCILAFIAHELVAHYDVKYAQDLREISIWEVHAHNYLATLPFFILLLIIVRRWETFVDFITLNWAGSMGLQWREESLGANGNFAASYIVGMGIFIVMPYMLELYRCWKWERDNGVSTLPWRTSA